MDQTIVTPTRPVVDVRLGANVVAKNFSELVKYSTFSSPFSSLLIPCANCFYRLVSSLPLQQIMISSLQQHSPQQSPFRLCCLLRSFTNHGEKIVKNERYSATTQKPENTQKLSKPGRFEMAPRKKAKASVTDVIVIEGPACFNPILNLSLAERWIGA